jgi:hypothetical protein
MMSWDRERIPRSNAARLELLRSLDLTLTTQEGLVVGSRPNSSEGCDDNHVQEQLQQYCSIKATPTPLNREQAEPQNSTAVTACFTVVVHSRQCADVTGDVS